MRLSVIIPCKNEVGVVEHLLDSLKAQTTPPDEIIVVDSHSDDATSAVAAAYSNSLPIKVIKAKGYGIAHARNEGVLAASGDLFLFIDADVRLPSNFIAQAFRQVAGRSLEVGGFRQRMPSTNWGIRAGSHVMNGYVRLMSLTPWPIAFSCFFATRKIHEAIGGFDPEVWIMEDYDYVYRARQTKAKFGIVRGTFFHASDRRFQSAAALSISQAIYAELYRYTHGMRITKPLYDYTMGGKPAKKKARQQAS
jgi:glycosyltransferase involved in cell wall biosynthesis